MRSATVLMILGALLVGSFIVFVAQVELGYYEHWRIDPDGNVIELLHGLQAPNPVLDAWRLVYLALGLATFGCGIVQFVQSRRGETDTTGKGERGSTIAQIVLGALVLTSLVVFLLWAEPGWGQLSVIRDGIEVTMQHRPGWVPLQIVWKAVSFLLGLAVTGLGVARLRRLRAEEAGQ